MTPKVLIFAGYGLNCEEETRFVFEKAGAEGDIVHVNDLIDGRKKLDDYQILAFPGGFSYGDDTGSGNAYANKVRYNLWDDLLKFIQQDKLIIGICNGCQILANLGLVPALGGRYGDRQMALMHNNTARYECRWVDMKVQSQKCVWTRGMDRLRCPVSHGEGRFYAEPEIIQALNAQDQVAFRYVKEDGSPANQEFPFSPNGAVEDIAAVCDGSGKILAIMPHPERNWSPYNQDDWTLTQEKVKRGLLPSLPEEGPGMKIFENGVRYFQ
ncbi:MAG: phosphoribosylformylglycinamidine synthase I [Candidatus Gracilibacteria bacterium]